MNLNQFHQFISDNELIDIAGQIDEKDFFYFKSKNRDLEFLGYGNILPSNQENTKSPQVILGTFEDQTNFYQFDNYIIKNKNEYNLSILKVPGFKKLESLESKDNCFNICPIENYETWEQMVSEALKSIQSKDFDKIVLKRDISLKCQNINQLIKTLLTLNNSPDNYIIYFRINSEEFISFTPEKLFELNDEKVSSMALAGSMPRSSNEEENIKNENILINDPKLIIEHSIVADEIYRRFGFFAKNINKSNLKTMKLNYVQHRLIEIDGQLQANKSIKDIIHELHPTPAVGTLPYQNGINIINKIENKKRNYYAAPIGVHYKNLTDVAVTLRSATILKEELILHAGCGIVKGSDPKQEWDETENKTKPFLKAIK